MANKYSERLNKIMVSEKTNFKKIVSLLNILRKELSHFDWNGDYSGLSEILVNINKLSRSISRKQQGVIKGEMEKIHQEIKSILGDKKKPSKNNSCFLELKRLIDNMEGMNLSYVYNYNDRYDGHAYSLLRYLLFKEKNLFFVKYALDQYPYLINVCDDQDNPIIYDIVIKYCGAIKRYIDSDFLEAGDLYYYDQVLEAIFQSPKIDFSKKLQGMTLRVVNDFLDQYDYHNLSQEKKNKLVFWVNELRFKLEGKSEEESLEHLSYKTDITIDFNEAVLSEAKRFSPNLLLEEYSKRSILRYEYIITIDGIGAEEIDDGLSIRKLDNGNYLLGVHISDPLGYIKRNSLLYDEAGRRTTSIYSPVEPTSSMFPGNYAKDYMSLIENKNRFGTSYYLEITPNGELLLNSLKIKKTVIRVRKSFTYEQFNDLAKRGSGDPELDEIIMNLQGVTQAISKNFVVDEKYRLAKRGVSNASATNITGNSDAEKIVEYAMLVINATVANMAAQRGFPFVYRGHELKKDYLAKIDYFDKKFRENPTSTNYEIFVKMLRDTYPMAFYTTDRTIGHMGLGMQHYAHLTSPLRRFADCLANEALNLFYFNQEVDNHVAYDFEERLKDGCRHINEKKATIDYFTERFVKIKKK